MSRSLEQRISPEGHLLLALGRSASSNTDRDAIDELLQRDLRWDRLVRLAVEHKLSPLVYHSLSEADGGQVPERVLEQLRHFFRAHFRRSFYLRSELPGLLNLLASHGIDALTFKGPVLATTGYPNEKVRPYLDLDILVRPEDVDETVSILESAGFEECNSLPASYESSEGVFLPLLHHVHGNAEGYVRDVGTPKELHVDVHWGLVSHYYSFPLDPEELWERRQSVTLENGATVSTFSPEDTLLVLCMHGSKHNLDRLSYVFDVAAFAGANPDLNWDWFLQKAKSLGSERSALLNLYLARELFHAPLPARVEEQTERRPAISSLAADVVADLFDGREGLSGLYRTCRFHLQIQDRWWEGLGAVYYTLSLVLQPTEEDRDWIALPSALEFLYYLFRPLRLLWDGERGPDRT